MKPKTPTEETDSRRISVLTAVSIALGIVLHRVFFLVAAAILLMVPFRRVARYLYELEQRPRRYRPA